MITITLYHKHKAGEISKEKFLYEVRRDNNLPFITNLTSYDDAIQILKNKGIVTDEKSAIISTPVVGLVTEAKKSVKELTLDTVNPYEYRHGLQYELDQLADYSDEALEKAKSTVLKNLSKDSNYYFDLLNPQPTEFKFKTPETDKPGMQARPDGHLKKEAKKDEKANVQDSLGKKEEGTKKPKGVKELTDKGVEGKEKIVKEGLEETPETSTPEEQFNQLMSKYDWYYEMSDDPRAYDRGKALDYQLKTLAKQLGADKAVELFNIKAPSDRKVTSTFFTESEDKHAKLKEILKNKVKEAIFKNKKGDIALASSTTSQSELQKTGYAKIPGTEDAVGIKK